jgi:hypothetical protein
MELSMDNETNLPWRRMGYAVVGDKVVDNNLNLGEIVSSDGHYCLIKWQYGKFGFDLSGLIYAGEGVWGVSHKASGNYCSANNSLIKLSTDRQAA